MATSYAGLLWTIVPLPIAIIPEIMAVANIHTVESENSGMTFVPNILILFVSRGDGKSD